MNQDYIYDKEVYPNVWTCAIEHAWTPQTWFFEISEERDDHHAFCQFVYQLKNLNARMIGFNNINYDYRILHAMVTGCAVIPQQIYNMNDTIINGGDQWAFSVWESDWIVNQIDLYKIHHFDNAARRTSLKVLEFNMRSQNIKDLPFPPGTVLTREQLPTLRKYNKHDASETKKFYHHSLDAIRMREDLSTKYNKNFLNHNDTKIGKDYFIMKLEESIPGSCYYRDHSNRKQPRQTIRGSIPLEPIIFNYIQFEHSEFKRILNHFKSQSVDSSQIKGFFKKLSCTINDFTYHFGAGGIHGSINSQSLHSDNDYVIIDIDVTAFYSKLAIANRLYPEHLSDQFCDIYLDVYDQRIATDKKSPENAMLKLALNGVYGDSNNVYSPFYDPAYTMSITINGQLLLCMLAEQLIKTTHAIKLIQVNTDGLTIKIPRRWKNHVDHVCDWWEKLTKLELERVEYSAMHIRDVNSYIAENTDGKLKRKGAYAHNRDDQRELPWHKDHSALVVAKAAEAALVRGEDIEDFIRGHHDFMDFMLRAKVPRSSRLVGVDAAGVDQPLENIQRYYVSNVGVALVKIMPPLAKKPDIYRRIGIDVGWQVATCNDLADVKLPINYDYYIQQAKKLVDPLR